jgi:polysaccharide pyruvyl transferase WcaK-like protein
VICHHAESLCARAWQIKHALHRLDSRAFARLHARYHAHYLAPAICCVSRTLALCNDMPLQQMGDQLGLTPPIVKMRLHRARYRVGEALGDQFLHA